jgi:hypothetical protein
MAEKVNVELGGKSKYQVAQDMARLIFELEDKINFRDVTRKEYLQAVYESILVLDGHSPS